MTEPKIRTVHIEEPEEFQEKRQKVHDDWLKEKGHGVYAPPEDPDTGTDHGDYWVGRDW